MALKPCKECKKEVSTDAKTCPSCGVKDPTTTASDIIGGIVILLVAVIAVRACMGNADEQSDDTPVLSDEQCMQDIQCWGDKHSLYAGTYCAEPIEKYAKYSFEWTDGMLGSKFSHFRWADKSSGTLTVIGDKLKFQNGFGAWQNMIYECDWNPVSKEVLAVRVSAGQI